MYQYEFEMVNKRTGRIEQKRATASTMQIARAQVLLMYGHQFKICAFPCNTYAPHEIAGEIDCSKFPARDIHWLMREAAAIEGAAQ